MAKAVPSASTVVEDVVLDRVSRLMSSVLLRAISKANRSASHTAGEWAEHWERRAARHLSVVDGLLTELVAADVREAPSVLRMMASEGDLSARDIAHLLAPAREYLADPPSGGGNGDIERFIRRRAETAVDETLLWATRAAEALFEALVCQLLAGVGGVSSDRAVSRDRFRRLFAVVLAVLDVRSTDVEPCRDPAVEGVI